MRQTTQYISAVGYLMGERAGSRGLTRRQVVEVQRARLVAAAIDALGEGGYACLTVASVIQRARVSRKTYYEIFENRDACFEAVFEDISARGLSVVRAAVADESGWLAAVRGALSSLLALIDEEPALARIWFVESLAGPPSVLERRARIMTNLADAVHGGVEVAGMARAPSRLFAEAGVGGVCHVIHTRLVEASDESLLAMVGSLMHLLTLPYLGQARASAELARASSRTHSGVSPVERPSLDESLRGLKIRLTYRTIRAMTAVFEKPGSSNLEISSECGIKDQGQVSKLLSRLDGLDLIENRGLGRDRGAPNAWYMTERGSNLVLATRSPDALAGPNRASTRRGADERGARSASRTRHR